MKEFFIVGCPRSGTTLLQQALNRHSQIAIPPETKFFFSFLGHSRTCQQRHLRRINDDLQINLPALAKRISSTDESRAFYRLLAGQYIQRLERPDIAYFGEKTPEHTGHLRRIRQLFPDAPIFFLYRDGRDVALSLSRVPWMHPDLYVNFMVWLYYYHILMRAHWDASLNIHLVRYEDMVRDPDRELRRITGVLGLGYEPNMARGSGNREGIPDRELAWKSRALEPIATDRIATWQRELSDIQVRHLECLGGSALQALGYELTTDAHHRLPLSFYPRLWWKLLGLLARLPWHCVANEFCGRSLCLARWSGSAPHSTRIGKRLPATWSWADPLLPTPQDKGDAVPCDSVSW